MEPRSDFPETETSSSDDTKSGLQSNDNAPWTPEITDGEKPTVTVNVTEDEDTFIETITVTDVNTKNVDRIVVEVLDKDGEPVVRIAAPLNIKYR